MNRHGEEKREKNKTPSAQENKAGRDGISKVAAQVDGISSTKPWYRTSHLPATVAVTYPVAEEERVWM